MSLAPDVELHTPEDDLDDLLWTGPTQVYNIMKEEGVRGGGVP